MSAVNFSLAGLSLRFRRYGTRADAFLRNLLTIARKRGGVNDFCPTPQDFSTLFDRVQLPGPIFECKIGLALDTQLVAGVVGNPLQRSGHPVQVYALSK